MNEIAKSAKQEVHLPENFEQLINQIGYGTTAYEIVTGDDSKVVEQLSEFGTELKRVKQKIKAKFVVDRRIGAKILFAADGKLQNYLENCRMAEDRTEVDDFILNFKEIVRNIANNRFFVDLPPLFTSEEK